MEYYTKSFLQISAIFPHKYKFRVCVLHFLLFDFRFCIIPNELRQFLNGRIINQFSQ